LLGGERRQGGKGAHEIGPSLETEIERQMEELISHFVHTKLEPKTGGRKCQAEKSTLDSERSKGAF